MAESLDDGEFWLPPQFLTDDDILMEKTNSVILMEKTNTVKKSKDLFGSDIEYPKALFPFEFPSEFASFGVSSDLSSPVESVVGSTETDSDEEDYLAGLTRQMAHSTLGGGLRKNDPLFCSKKSKSDLQQGWVVSGSPQSTLCAVGSGCGCRQGSSSGSPNGNSQVLPLPATWDLLYAAAGEVARMRMKEEVYSGLYTHKPGLLGPPRKPSPVSFPMKTPKPDNSHYPQPSLPYQKLQASQFEQLRQQQLMKQQQQTSGVWGGQAKGFGPYQQQQTLPPMIHNKGRNTGKPLGLPGSAWPSLQQAQLQQNQSGSGMRAVFLGNPGGKRECAGTGVFLPRRVGTPAETRKKPACSTALLPARVVQALSLNLDDMNGSEPLLQPHFNGNFNTDTDFDSVWRARNGNAVSQHKRGQQQAMNNEVMLPQEWTY